MIVEREDNSALYFIVGGLLVAVMAFAFFYFRGQGPADVIERQTIVEKAPANDSRSMSLSVDDNGVNATTTNQQ